MNLSPDILERLYENLLEQGCIVDVGCGDGFLLRSLPKSEHNILYGIDPCFTDKETSDDNIRFLRSTAERLPLPSRCADAIIMQCVFSLCEPVQAVRELNRVLKDNGVLLIADLYSNLSDSYFSDNPLICNIYFRRHLEAFFTHTFRMTKFYDETDALKEMFAQIILNGDDEICSVGNLMKLREKKARYGLWVWKKN